MRSPQSTGIKIRSFGQICFLKDGITAFTLFRSRMCMRSITVADYETIFGRPLTDQITFVVATTADAVGYPAGVRCVNFYIKRLNWKQNLASSTVLFTYDEDADEVNINSAAVDLDRSSSDIVESLTGITPEFSANDKALDLSGVIAPMRADAGIYNAGFAIIASRFVDGTWKRSTQRLMVKPGIGAQSTNTAIKNGWGYNDLYYLLEDINTKARETEDRYLNKEKNK